MKTCKDCSNFLGGGDWNLCCKNPPKDQVGWCGFLCYEDTEACKNFKARIIEELNVDRCLSCGEIIPEGRWICRSCELKPTQFVSQED